MTLKSFCEFPRAEYELRLKRARELMEERQLDALLVTGDYQADENYRYFSGHRSNTRRRPAVVILSKNQAPVLVMDWTGKGEATKVSWIKDIRTYEYEGLTSELLEEVLHDLGLDEARIGAELNDSYDAFRINMRYEEFRKLQRNMGSTAFLDASEILWRLRVKKSKAEMECLRKAADITSKVYDAWYPTLREGMTEREAAQNLIRLYLEEGADFGGYPTGIPFSILWTGRRDLPRRATDRALKRGDWVRIDGGAHYKGYCADFCRASVVGKPTEEQKKSWEMAVEMSQKSLEAVRPGARISDVARAAIETQRRLGFSTEFLEKYHMGHGIGLNVPEPPMVMLSNDTVIEPGMALTVEPMVYFGSPVMEEQFIVTEGGYELLSKAGTGLHVIRV